jgi:hypothetical protein
VGDGRAYPAKKWTPPGALVKSRTSECRALVSQRTVPGSPVESIGQTKPLPRVTVLPPSPRVTGKLSAPPGTNPRALLDELDRVVAEAEGAKFGIG